MLMGDVTVKPDMPEVDLGDPINAGRFFVVPLYEGAGFPTDIGRGLISTTQTGAWGVGKNGQQITLSTTSDAVIFPKEGPVTSLSYPVTVRAWVRTGTDVTSRGIVNLGYTSSSWLYGVFLNLSWTAKLSFGFGDGGSGSTYYRYVEMTSTLSANTEYQIVGVYDADLNGAIWVDGVEAATSETGTATAVTMGNDPVIGRGSSNGYDTFDGDIYAVDAWDRALTAAEVQRLYAEPWAGLIPRRHIPAGRAPSSIVMVPGHRGPDVKPDAPELDWNDPINRGLDFRIGFYEGGGDPHDLTGRYTVDLPGATTPATWGLVGGEKAVTTDATNNGQGMIRINNCISSGSTTILLWAQDMPADDTYDYYLSNSNVLRGLFISTRASTNKFTPGVRTDNLRFGTASTSTFDDGKPHLFGLIWDETTDELHTVFDGRIEATASITGGPMTAGEATDDIIIGTYNNQAGFATIASYGQAGKWNRALSASEVMRLYAEPWAGFRNDFPLPLKLTEAVDDPIAMMAM